MSIFCTLLQILLYSIAKKAFDQLLDKKVPSRKTLNEEFYWLLVEKKTAYAEYRQF